MTRTRAVTLTALVAASAMVFAACSSSPGQSTPSSSAATAAATSAASGSSSAAPVSSGAPTSGAASSGVASSGTASSGVPGYTKQPAGTEGCGMPHGPYTDPGAAAGTVTTGSAELATSWNNLTSHGNSVYNANPQYFTQAQENYYDKDLNLVNNDQFIQCVVTSKSPLTVKYTINAAAKWSDGVPVTASDLILAWGAQSGEFSTGALKTDKDGNPVANPNAVAFDSQSQGLALITKFPQASADNKSLTVVYDQPFVDYALNLTVGVPAHVTAMKALGMTDPTAATAALVDAFKTKKTADLVKIANFWNTGFDFTALPSDKSLYLSDGAYLLTDFKANQFMTFTANPDYTWGPKPTVKTITYQFLPDATAAVQAIANGEVQIYYPEHPTADTTKGLAALVSQGIKYKVGVGGSYEHVDLVFNNGGPFDPKTYGGDATKALEVRQAFLKTIPRQGILDRLVKPINSSAVLRDSFTQVPGSPLYDTVTKSNGMSAYDKVDIAGAKALLAKAGVSNLKVRLLYSSTNPVRGQEFALMAASAQQAGITLVDGKDPNWSSNLPNISKYDASLFAWQNTNLGIAQIPPNYIGSPDATKRGQNNYGQFNNAQVNKDMNTLNVTSDSATQNKLIESTEKVLVDNAFGTILYQYPDIVGYDGNKVSNVSSIPVSPAVFWNFWEWKLAGS